MEELELPEGSDIIELSEKDERYIIRFPMEMSDKDFQRIVQAFKEFYASNNKFFILRSDDFKLIKLKGKPEIEATRDFDRYDLSTDW